MTPSRFFYSSLFVKFIVMILVILFAGIGLGPDEAQYWTWSRNLDWGYYSKPPGIAWQIFATTSLFGQTELGVRMSALIIGTLFALAVFRLAKKVNLSPWEACLAGLMAAFTPLGIFSTFLTITDGGLLLFWTLALTELAEPIERGSKVNYALFGLFIAFGALFKWPIYLLWLVVVGLWIWKKEFRSPAIIMGILISLLGLLPTLYWNFHHDFATFKHVSTIVKGGNDGGAGGNPLEFIGSQIAILSPIIFALLILSWANLRRATPALAFLGLVSLLILIGYTTDSFFKKGQGNWCLFAYPSAFVFIAACMPSKWIKAGLVLSILLTAFIFLIPTLQRESWGYPIPWKMNPFRHNVGWGRLGHSLEGQNGFLFADKYQITSVLSFYQQNQDRAYFFNLLGSRKNQFSYESPPPKGKDGIFVVVESGADWEKKLEGQKVTYDQLLAPYFVKVNSPQKISLFEAYGKSVKGAFLFNCEGFLGKLPDEPEKY